MDGVGNQCLTNAYGEGKIKIESIQLMRNQFAMNEKPKLKISMKNIDLNAKESKRFVKSLKLC